MNDPYEDQLSGDIAYLQSLHMPPWGAPRRHEPPMELREIVKVVRDSICEDIYPDEEYGTHERAFHADLPYLSEMELTDHRDRLRLRLLMEPRPSAWLRDRMASVLLELKQRLTATEQRR